MNKDQYNEWRNHPATLFFRQFLKDKSSDLIHRYTEEWLAGSPAFDKENPEARGYIRGLMECSDVSFEVIQLFYEGKNAAENAEADAGGIRPGEISGEQ